MCTRGSYVENQLLVNDTVFLKTMLSNLKKCEELTNATMKCYTSLTKTVTDNTQSFINASTQCNQRSNSVHSLNNVIRDLSGNDEFMKYNAQVHSETLRCIELLINETKALQKALDNLKSNQKAYESARQKIHKKEAKYSKANKSLTESSTYRKITEKRDSLKKLTQSKQEEYKAKKENLVKRVSETLSDAYNNYLECTSNFTMFLGNMMKKNIHVRPPNPFEEAQPAYAL
ncbi:unnamed protein product [Phytomonas sp. EM1]|nr:unnamed protein product [Phytomonas sp. EM1]|eukprot:CCW60919.1 unnamed protein product [Phytomonas sp. isolate EM1]